MPEKTMCSELENQIFEGKIQKQLPPELKSHLDSCEKCQELWTIHLELSGLAQKIRRERQLTPINKNLTPEKILFEENKKPLFKSSLLFAIPGLALILFLTLPLLPIKNRLKSREKLSSNLIKENKKQSPRKTVHKPQPKDQIEKILANLLPDSAIEKYAIDPIEYIEQIEEENNLLFAPLPEEELAVNWLNSLDTESDELEQIDSIFNQPNNKGKTGGKKK